MLAHLHGLLAHLNKTSLMVLATLRFFFYDKSRRHQLDGFLVLQLVGEIRESLVWWLVGIELEFCFCLLVGGINGRVFLWVGWRD